jgi:hypothetical protein
MKGLYRVAIVVGLVGLGFGPWAAKDSEAVDYRWKDTHNECPAACDILIYSCPCAEI